MGREEPKAEGQQGPKPRGGCAGVSWGQEGMETLRGVLARTQVEEGLRATVSTSAAPDSEAEHRSLNGEVCGAACA